MYLCQVKNEYETLKVPKYINWTKKKGENINFFFFFKIWNSKRYKNKRVLPQIKKNKRVEIENGCEGY